jgi:hypothetical protein
MFSAILLTIQFQRRGPVKRNLQDSISENTRAGQEKTIAEDNLQKMRQNRGKRAVSCHAERSRLPHRNSGGRQCVGAYDIARAALVDVY